MGVVTYVAVLTISVVPVGVDNISVVTVGVVNGGEEEKIKNKKNRTKN